MSWRSITALLILAFAGGAGGFAYLSANGQLPWATKTAPAAVAAPEPKDEIASLVPNAGFAVPTIIQPSASQAEAMLLVKDVRDSIEAGKALGPLGSRLQVTFAASQPQALAIIASGSKKPISNAQLLAGFDSITPQLLLPVETLWDRARREMNSLFVRRSNDAPITASAARVGRIRGLIISGDIAAAAQAVRAMPGSASASAWMADAARAIAVHQALDQLNRSAATPPPPPPPVFAPAQPVLEDVPSELPTVAE
ncbi:MAG: hypothetical protein ABL928_09495 [Sphingorhabdus sp.]